LSIQSIFGVIVGPSGIGKRYGVGQILIEYFGAHVFVTGDWCREHQKEFTLAGTLAPDDRIVQATEEDYIKQGSPRRFLVDCPRNLAQAESFIRMFRRWDPEAQLVTYHISAKRSVCEESIRHRALLHRRLDDARPDVIDNRLAFYFGPEGIRETVVPHLKKVTNYRFINGHHPLEDIRHVVREEHGPAVFEQAA